MQYIDVKTESIELASHTETDVHGLKSAISGDGPRYSLYKVAAGQGLSSGGGLVFIYTCPEGLGVKDRMLHAGSKRGFLTGLEKDLGIDISRKVSLIRWFPVWTLSEI